MKMSKKLTKASCQRAHAKRRALQRYSLILNRQDLDDIVSKIKSRDAEFVERQSNRVTIWRLSFKETLIRVVYDSLRHTIVTFLPLEPKSSNSS